MKISNTITYTPIKTIQTNLNTFKCNNNFEKTSDICFGSSQSPIGNKKVILPIKKILIAGIAGLSVLGTTLNTACSKREYYNQNSIEYSKSIGNSDVIESPINENNYTEASVNQEKLSPEEWLNQYNQAISECYNEIPMIDVPLTGGGFDPDADFMAQTLTKKEYPADAPQRVDQLMKEKHAALLKYLDQTEYAQRLQQQQYQYQAQGVYIDPYDLINSINEQTEADREEFDQKMLKQAELDNKELQFQRENNERWLKSHPAPRYVP